MLFNPCPLTQVDFAEDFSVTYKGTYKVRSLRILLGKVSGSVYQGLQRDLLLQTDHVVCPCTGGDQQKG